MPYQRGKENKNTAKAAVHPTIRDLEWAAGFLEGEGHFRSTKGRFGTQQCHATQVQREPLERLLRLFGGVIHGHTKPTTTHQRSWRWWTTGSRARGVMMTLYSLMSTRRKEQIRVALIGDCSER